MDAPASFSPPTLRLNGGTLSLAEAEAVDAMEAAEAADVAADEAAEAMMEDAANDEMR